MCGPEKGRWVELRENESGNGPEKDRLFERKLLDKVNIQAIIIKLRIFLVVVVLVVLLIVLIIIVTVLVVYTLERILLLHDNPTFLSTHP